MWTTPWQQGMFLTTHTHTHKTPSQAHTCRTGQYLSSGASMSQVILLKDAFVSSRVDKDEDTTQ